MKSFLPNVFNYLYYRQFLKDYRVARSRIDIGFTHYYICHRLGMKNSRGYFNNITSGRKNLSPETTEKLILLLELSTDEANYFRVLVNYNQTEHPEQKRYWFDQLVKMNTSPQKIIPEDCYEYFTTWYHPVIREKLEDFPLKDNFPELASRLIPPISADEVKASVDLLERLQLITKDESGYYCVTDKTVATDPYAKRTLIEQYQLSVLDRARERITSRPKEHKTTTLTFAVSQNAFKQVLVQIDQLKKAIRTIAYKDGNNEKKVYELISHFSRQSE